MTASLFVLLAASPFFLGFLVLPWLHLREHGLRLEHPWGSLAALLVVAALFATAARTDWPNPLTLWLSGRGLGTANRTLPLIWCLFALPCWAMAVIAFAPTARRLCALWPALATAPADLFRAIGWMGLAIAWALFAVMWSVG